MYICMYMCWNVGRPEHLPQDQRLDHSCGALRYHMEGLNEEVKAEVHSHLEAAVTNFLANARWRFVDPDGPRIPKVDHKKEQPIMFK